MIQFPTLRCVVACIIVGAALWASPHGQQPSGTGEHRPAVEPPLPPLPPGAVRVIHVTRHGDRFAMCAAEPGPLIQHGTLLIPRTRVWIHDGVKTRQAGMAPGSCDTAWSADGQHVAVVAPDGLWVLTPDLGATMHLVDIRHTEAPGDEAQHRSLASPAWAPDGSRVAFRVSNSATSWVEAVDARTGTLAYASPPETYDFAWGADSASLRFGSRVVPVP